MPKQNVLLNKFNRGLVSPLALARIDLENINFYAETMTNWSPRVLGSMMLRVGTEYKDSTYSNAAAKHIPFIFSNSDTAIIEMTDSLMRVRVSESVITRNSVSTSVTNGTFSSDISGWTDASGSGATASWHSSGYASLVGNTFNSAELRQTLTVAGGDQNVEHAIRVTVVRGTIVFKVGSASGGDQYVSETTLGVGIHSLAFTPTGASVFVSMKNSTKFAALVDSISIESSGNMTISTPYVAADLSKLRWTQSADVIYIACDGYQQRKIERRGTRSWSFVKYEPEDGPFRNINTTQKTITASATTGDVTLTASDNIFRSTHVGSLFRIDSTGQRVDISVTAENQWSDPVKVTGTSTSRDISVTRSGTWTATVTLQRSVGDIGNWVDVTTYTTNATVTYNDTLDNQIIYYRIGVDTGDFTSGTAVLQLDVASGSITGIARITAYTSAVSVSASVLKPLGSISATANWYEGQWSDYRGYPTAVTLYDGRAVFVGRDRFIATVSDTFESYDDEVEGDSATINRSIGSGPVDKIGWMLPLYRLTMGGEADEYEVRSSSLEEPITPSNCNIKSFSGQGSANIQAAKLDSTGVFIQKSAKRIFEFGYSQDQFATYEIDELTKLFPEAAGTSTFTHLSVQRLPDTRIHCMRADGKVIIIVRDRAESIKCIWLYETDGTVEDIFTMPGAEEDYVYYVVNRTINGSTKRYLERWAFESECEGSTLNKQADCFKSISQASSTTITGLSHLEAETVVVWANGKDLGDYTVSGGQITVSEAVTTAIVGLEYTAQFKSSKLAYAAANVALSQTKRVNKLGLILRNTHYQGIQYGPDFTNMDQLPLVEDGTDTASNTIHSEFDADMMEFNDTWNTDSRICLKAVAPRPCTVLAAIVQIATHDEG